MGKPLKHKRKRVKPSRMRREKRFLPANFKRYLQASLYRLREYKKGEDHLDMA